MSKTKFLIGIFLFFLAHGIALGKEWRGIKPLHARRADVVRLFKQCENPKLDCEFDFENERVRIVFSADGDNNECSDELAKDTVLRIEVTPNTQAIEAVAHQHETLAKV